MQGKILAGVDGLGRDEITQPGHAGIGASQTELREENVQIHGGNLDRIGAVAETAVERGLRRESSKVKQRRGHFPLNAAGSLENRAVNIRRSVRVHKRVEVMVFAAHQHRRGVALLRVIPGLGHAIRADLSAGNGGERGNEEYKRPQAETDPFHNSDTKPFFSFVPLILRTE